MRTLLLPLLVLVACDDTVFPTPHGSVSDGDDPLEGWCAVDAMISSQCIGCHQGGAGAAGGLDLSADAHTALIEIPSSQFDGAVLVLPGDPDQSLFYTKIAGTQASTEGGPMPPPGGLDDDALIEAVRQWIEDGASDECTDPGTGTGRYHPDDFAQPTVHPLAAKLHEQTCTDCHGDDLDGGTAGVSCDSCHTPDDPPAWRTDCTFCHGGVDDLTGAPPEEIDDGDEDLSFGAHARHVSENTHAAYDCTQCHSKPTDVLTPGHMFDDTPVVAETDFSGGLSAGASWSSSAASCSDAYCHGTGRRDGDVQVSDGPLSCDSCHPDKGSSEARIESMSGEHHAHVWDERIDCAECHADTTDRYESIVTPALHVDGDVQVRLTEGSITLSGGRCTGSCHGEEHRSETWFDD